MATASASGVNGKSVAVVFAGAVLMYSGIKKKRVTDVIRSLIAGKNPALTASDVTGSGPIPQTSSTIGSAGFGTGAVSHKQNQALGKRLAAAVGWTGDKWTALNNLVMQESGWNNTAQNSTSTAYGIGQFLDSTWAGTGYKKTSDPLIQIYAMYTYIKHRYHGDPREAWNHELQYGWY